MNLVKVRSMEKIGGVTRVGVGALLVNENPLYHTLEYNSVGITGVLMDDQFFKGALDDPEDCFIMDDAFSKLTKGLLGVRVIKKLPEAVMVETRKILQVIYDIHRTEGAVLIGYLPDGTFITYIPEQSVSGAHVSLEDSAINKIYEAHPGVMIAASFHSHPFGGGSGFLSGTDHSNAQNIPGVPIASFNFSTVPISGTALYKFGALKITFHSISMRESELAEKLPEVVLITEQERQDIKARIESKVISGGWNQRIINRSMFDEDDSFPSPGIWTRDLKTGQYKRKTQRDSQMSYPAAAGRSAKGGLIEVSQATASQALAEEMAETSWVNLFLERLEYTCPISDAVLEVRDMLKAFTEPSGLVDVINVSDVISNLLENVLGPAGEYTEEDEWSPGTVKRLLRNKNVSDIVSIATIVRAVLRALHTDMCACDKTELFNAVFMGGPIQGVIPASRTRALLEEINKACMTAGTPEVSVIKVTDDVLDGVYALIDAILSSNSNDFMLGDWAGICLKFEKDNGTIQGPDGGTPHIAEEQVRP